MQEAKAKQAAEEAAAAAKAKQEEMAARAARKAVSTCSTVLGSCVYVNVYEMSDDYSYPLFYECNVTHTRRR